MKDELDIINVVYKNAEMGLSTTGSLLKNLQSKDNKISCVVEDIYNSYKQFENECDNLLSTYNEKGKKAGVFASVSADIGIKMNVLKDNSDSSIADMLIKGLTMGELEMIKLEKSFNNSISKSVRELVVNFKNFQTNAISKLKKYI